MKLRALLLISGCLLLAGCVSHALTGNFRAKSGERLEIARDGRILLHSAAAVTLVGRIHAQDDLFSLVTRRDNEPHAILADHPVPGCVCIGLQLTYADDRSAIFVQWPAGFNQRGWPAVFVKE